MKIVVLLFLFIFNSFCMAQKTGTNYLTPETFKLVKQHIREKGDTVTLNVSSRTDRSYDITYYFIDRNGYRFQTDEAERIYISKDNQHLGNILFLFQKTVETEIPEGIYKKEHERIVLQQYEEFAEELLKPNSSQK